MKNLIKFCAITLLIFAACKNEKAEKVEKKATVVFDSFGDKITKDAALNSDEMLAKFNTMRVGDNPLCI